MAGYKPYAGDFGGRTRGNLLSFETGTATPFALTKVQERGALFSAPGDEVYEDQIVGIHAKENDLKVNVCKTKQLTNMRSAGADDKSTTTPPMQVLSLRDLNPQASCIVQSARPASRIHLKCPSMLFDRQTSIRSLCGSQLTLEDAVEYIIPGEFVEVTPDAIRMGKFPKESRFAKK